MPQFKEDKLIAEAYNNITEIASVYDDPDSSEELDKIKEEVLDIIYELTKGGKVNFITPSGQTFTVGRIFVMLSEAKTKQEIKEIIELLGFTSME